MLFFLKLCDLYMSDVLKPRLEDRPSLVAMITTFSESSLKKLFQNIGKSRFSLQNVIFSKFKVKRACSVKVLCTKIACILRVVV